MIDQKRQAETTERREAESYHLQGTVIIAMVAVRMVQVAIHEIVRVIAMRHSFMPATRAMHMSRIVPATLVVWRATVGIGVRDLDYVLIHMIVMHVVKVSIV